MYICYSSQEDKMVEEFEVVSGEVQAKVTMSNRLARSAQNLSLSEKRIVALALANVDSKSTSRLVEASTERGWKTKIKAHDYAEAFNIDPNTAYDQLKAASERLFERMVSYDDKNSRGKSRNNKFRWVSLAQYTVGEGLIELNFTPEIAPHLLGLKSHFTSYKLKHAASFESIYAWRLFEVLESWRSTGLFSTSIEDFWETMEAPPSCRKDFKSLRVRVIEPAVNSIQLHAGLKVEWLPIRSGARRVTSLEFRFGPDPQGKLDLGEPIDNQISIVSDAMGISPTNP
jgi:plasmid replication initiation protein